MQAGDRPCSGDPMHFCHLGRDYFQGAFRRCWILGCWPVRTIATGKTGDLVYQNHAFPNQVNWMAVACNGRTCTNQDRFDSYNRRNVIPWPASAIAAHFKIDVELCAEAPHGSYT